MDSPEISDGPLPPKLRVRLVRNGVFFPISSFDFYDAAAIAETQSIIAIASHA
jgi:hypothetical protein